MPTENSLLSVLNNSRIVFRLLAFTLIFIPILVNPDLLTDTSELPKEIFGSISIGICLPSLAILIFTSKNDFKIYFEEAFLWIGFVGLLITSFASSFWATNSSLSLLNAYLWSISLINFALIAALRASFNECLLMLVALVIGASMNSCLALYQYYFDTIPSFQAAPPAGSFGNRNFAAQLIVTALPMCMTVIVFTKKFSHYSWAALCSLILGLHLFHTFTRACWISLFCTFVLFGILFICDKQVREDLLRSLSWKKLCVCFIGLLLFGFGANLSSEGFEWKFGSAITRINSIGESVDIARSLDEKSNNGSIKSRLLYWTNAFVMLKDTLPLGVGEGNFKVIFPQYSHAIYPSNVSGKDYQLRFLHQDYLEMLIEFGIFGFLFGGFILLGFFSLLYLFFKRNSSTTHETRLVFIGVVFGLIGLCITGFFSGPFQQTVQKLYLFVLFGILVSLLSIITNRKRKTISISLEKIHILLILPLGIVFIILGSIRYYSYIQANKEYKSMFLCTDSENWNPDAAGLHAKKALSYRPKFLEVRMLYAATLLKNQQHDLALEQMKVIEKAYPFDYKNMENMAILYIQTGKFDLALKTFELMESIIPGDPKALENAAKIESERSNYKEAEKLLLRYADGFYSKPLAFILLAQNAMKDHRYNDAGNFLINGLKKFPEDDLLLRSLSLYKNHIRQVEQR